MNPTQLKYKESLEKLAAILAPIAEHAEVQAGFRCPYKNKLDECTAKFGCRNQRKQDNRKLMICVGDDKLDYRPFWEVDSNKMHTIEEEIKKVGE